MFSFCRGGSYFIFKCWIGRNSEFGGQTTSSEQREESCNAAGVDAKQVQEIMSTSIVTANATGTALITIVLFGTILQWCELESHDSRLDLNSNHTFADLRLNKDLQLDFDITDESGK